MGYPLDNLGDYKVAQDLVKSAGGSLERAIGNAIEQATPAIIEKAAPAIKRTGQMQGGIAIALIGTGLAAGVFATRQMRARRLQESENSQVEEDGTSVSNSETPDDVEDQLLNRHSATQPNEKPQTKNREL